MHGPPTDEVTDRAQSSPIGVVLILGITLSAAVAIVVIGGGALESSQEDSRIGQAEQALTQFDSKAAQVSLGDSETQSVTLGTNGGTYTVDEDAGTLRIYHQDWNESETGEPDEYIYGNDSHGVPLGAVIYRTGDTTIAYQGGGVWRRDGDGGVSMVSPPEFHYREATLTFPIVRLEGSGSVSGNARGRISRNQTARNVYPDLENVSTDHSEQYSGDPRIYSNPVQEGNMTVEVESQYCEAWRRYFLERTEGVVTECGDDDNVTAQIVALGTQGEFDITTDNNVRIRGMDPGHSLENLRFEFRDDTSQSSAFNNFEWEMSGTDEDGNEIGVFLYNNGNANNLCDESDPNLPVRTTIYYNNASNDDYGAFVIPQSDTANSFNITCDGDLQVLNVNLLDSSRNATYQSLGSKDPWNPDGTLHGTEVFDHPDHDDNMEPASFDSNDEVPLNLTVQHYFGLLGDADLTIRERSQGSSGIGESSTGNMEYHGGGQVITFLHVTENRIEIELE